MLLCRPYGGDGNDAVVLARATTDSEGRFTIEPPATDPSSVDGSPNERLNLWADAPGRSPLVKPGTLNELNAQPLELVLDTIGVILRLHLPRTSPGPHHGRLESQVRAWLASPAWVARPE